MQTKKTVLITGGAGFIGANIVYELLAQNETSIHVLTEPKSNLWRLTNALSSITTHEIDLTDFAQIRKLIQAIKPQQIYHLASYGGLPTQKDQSTIYNVNFHATMHLLNCCKEVGFECFINTGSSSEYGMKKEPMREDTLLEPVSDYGVAKAAATLFCLKEALQNKLPIYTVRPFSVYGNYEMPERLIPTVLTGFLTGNPLYLSSPYFVRDFIYIKDIVRLYLLIAERLPQDTFIFNGGTGIQSSVQDVISTIEKLIPQAPSIIWAAHTPRPWEPQAWKADITQTTQSLGWKPTFTLVNGLASSLVWFKQHLSLYPQGEGHVAPQPTKRPTEQQHTA